MDDPDEWREKSKVQVQRGGLSSKFKVYQGFIDLQSSFPDSHCAGDSLRLKLRSAIRVEQIIIFKMVPVLTCVLLVTTWMELIASNVRLDVLNVGKLTNASNVKPVFIYKKINASQNAHMDMQK